jgi:hypothetical protein
MQITRTNDGQVELLLSFDELDTIKNCVNEVSGGFTVTDFKTRIGADEDTVSRLADEMVAALSGDEPAGTGGLAGPSSEYVRRLLNRK